jgi:hypothetical protein
MENTTLNYGYRKDILKAWGAMHASCSPFYIDFIFLKGRDKTIWLFTGLRFEVKNIDLLSSGANVHYHFAQRG